MSRPTVDQLTRALKLSEQIAKLEAELAGILGNAGAPRVKRAYTKKDQSPALATEPTKKKRKKAKMSPEGLANIIAAQKKRWAKQKKEAAKKKAE